jgi:hypothetical protein
LGYPIIIGFLPRLQVADGATPLSLFDSEPSPDTGNYSPGGALTKGDQNSPADMVQGDVIYSSIGGSILALLRGGSAFLRASRGAEVFLSKLFGLVRIVSRNWEHFTDMSSDVVKNWKGRLYRYTGYARTFPEAKNEDYNLHFHYGDVPASEAIKTAYSTFSGSPNTNTLVYKKQVTDKVSGVPREIHRNTLDLTGNKEVWVYNGTHFTRVSSTAEQLTFAWNDQNTVVINETKIEVHHKDGANLILDASGIRATFKDGIVNMADGSITTSYGSSSSVMGSSQIQATNGSGSALISSALTKISNGAHSVTVTSAGVAIV